MTASELATVQMLRKDVAQARRYAERMTRECDRLTAVLRREGKQGRAGRAVVAASINAYRHLVAFGDETLGYFYERAHPSVRKWALATKAFLDEGGGADHAGSSGHQGTDPGNTVRGRG